MLKCVKDLLNLFLSKKFHIKKQQHEEILRLEFFFGIISGKHNIGKQSACSVISNV